MTPDWYSILVFIALSLAMRASAQAAEPALGLDQAIREAADHSPSLQRYRAAAEESGWRQTETVGAGLMPKLSATGSHYFNEKYQFLNVAFGGTNILFPSIYPSSTGSLDLTVPIFDGLANVDHVQAATAARDASEADLRHAEFDLGQDVQLAFYQALAAERLEDVAKQNVTTLEEHLRLAEASQHGGAGTRYDVLRVQVQLTEARTDVSNATDNVSIARKKLTLLMGLKDDERPLTGDLPAPIAAKVEQLVLKEVPPDRADLQALAFRVKSAEKERTAGAKWLVPSVSLAADYTVYNNIDSSIDHTDLFRSAYNFGVLLQWNLFDGGVSIARAQESKYRQVQAESAAEEAQDRVPRDFDLWKRKYLTNAARYEAKNLDVARSEESVRLARAEQKAGTRNSTEVLDAELDLFRSKAGVVDALMSSAEAQIELEKTLGKKL